MDKADASAREHIAATADLVGAIRLPEGSFRADAGTDVVVDILFFRKRRDGDTPGERCLARSRRGPSCDRGRGRYPGEPVFRRASGDGARHACTRVWPVRRDLHLRAASGASISKTRSPPRSCRLPDAVYDGEPETIGSDADETPTVVATAAGVSIREGSYFVGSEQGLDADGRRHGRHHSVKKGRNADGIFDKHARIIRKLIPIRDAVREILKCQETDQPWKQAQVRLRIAWSIFVRDFGPINTTVVSSIEDEETGEVRETHRRPNLAPFADDPDCWLVASIEDYDLESNTARPGPIFTERVIAPPPAPAITSAVDALAVVLNERGAVDPDAHRGAPARRCRRRDR